jgi:TRAP-type C4-dicarboxylate transport system substrate-binding protein
VKVKFYAGGVAGDERDAVRKMRLGQMSGAAVTAIGLGLIQPEVRALELPMLMSSYEELDYVRSKMDAELRKKFDDKGYVLLFWGDVGPVYFFSNTPLKTKGDLAQTKLWAWGDDPLVLKMFEQGGITGVRLGVPDVLPSLQTGLINACYGSPLATLALQWYTKVKYMSAMQLSQSIGATVLAKKEFDKLADPEKQALLADSKELEGRLLKQIREENASALAAMKKSGLQVVDSPKEMITQFEADAKAIRPKLEGAVYSHDFRERVEKLLTEYRAQKH